jgi:hypothetical protein
VKNLKGVANDVVAVGPDAIAGATQPDITGLYPLERRGGGGGAGSWEITLFNYNPG